MTDDTDRCDAIGCGRRHGTTSFISAFDSNVWCSFHAGKLEAGEGVECRDGDTAHYDDEYGLILMPTRWQPEQELTT